MMMLVEWGVLEVEVELPHAVQSTCVVELETQLCDSPTDRW
jgi:hypothetical protein